MSGETFIIGSAFGARSVLARIGARIAQLTFAPGRHYVVTLERIDPRGTESQRRKIRAIVGEIAEHTGEDAALLYEQLLARRFGIEEVPLGDGRVWNRPAKRVSSMSTQERSAYIDWLQALAAEYGVRLKR